MTRPAAAVGRSRVRGRERGFTLVELMVALVVSSLLIGMILSIFTRMSVAYRAQQNIAELQRTLAAAQEMIQRDVRQAGLGMPDGFRWAGGLPEPHTTVQALQIINNADGFGPDSIRVYYADGSAQARVALPPNPLAIADKDISFTSVVVDDADRFEVGDLAVLVTMEKENLIRQPNDAEWWHHRACIVRISDIAGTTFSLDTAAPWGSADNDQCDAARLLLALGSGMMYRFTARAYRIDPTRRSLGVLQMSPSGALIDDDWQDLGVGFTDLQVASRWNDWWADRAGDTARTDDTDDVDNDAMIEWYSGELQETLSAPLVSPPPAPFVSADDPVYLYHRPVPAEARITLVVRTLKRIDAIPTAATPQLTDPARVDNNDLGDRPAVPLEGVADAARPVELRGEAVYRHATIGADLRNLAVGQ